MNNTLTENQVASQVAVLTADIMAIPFPRWKLCCCTLDGGNFLPRTPYDVPVNDTQKHVPFSESLNCFLTGKPHGQFWEQPHKDKSS